MNIFSGISALWAKDEAWAISFVQSVQSGIVVLESDFEAFWTWLGQHSSEITADAQMVTKAIGTAQSMGLPIPAAVGVAVAGMNAAVAGMNAAFNAQAAGANTAQSVVAGYTAAKQAQIAHGQAAIAVITVPKK